MSLNLPQMNDMVSVGDLAALNKALRKSNVGYQTPAVPSAGGADALSPLVPQSIEGTLASATYTMKELALWPAIAKRQVTNTVHEFNVIEDHGFDLDPFIAEGGGGLRNQSTYQRKHLRIKYMAERREVSDVSTLVNILGSNPTAIAEETERGTLRLMQKVERQLFHGREAINDLGFDGIFEQIVSEQPANVTDLAGGEIDPQTLQGILGELTSAPNFGRPDTIYVEPKVHANLIQQTVNFGRHDQLTVSGASGLTFGAQNLSIMGPYGPVAVKQAPFLFTSFEAPAAASHSLAAPAITGAGTTQQPTNNGAGTSLWVAADVGDYIWQIVAVSVDDGFSAPLTTAALTIGAGMLPRMVIDQQDGVDYYRVYRTETDGLATTATFVFEVSNNVGGETTIDDNHDVKRNTSRILVAQHDPGVMEFVRLLDFLRRPLAEIATTRPFLLMLFGAPAVKVPSKLWMLDNVSAG
jgi:hypothetical protein